MTPHSSRTRFLYFIFFVLLFISAAPFILLYSMGYNWGKNFSILKTGGIYVYAPQNGVDVYVDNKLDNTTSIFQHSILVKDLRPNQYTIRVTKTGYLDWKKTVPVKEEKVAEVYPFLIPANIVTTNVPQQIHSTNSTTSALVVNTEYKNLITLFATSSKPKVPTTLNVSTSSNISASSTLPFIESKKVVVEKDGNILHALWQGGVEDTPFYFCISDASTCAKDFLVYSAPSIGTFDFYPNRNDILLVATGPKLTVVELDKRPPQNIVELYTSSTGESLDFRVVDNETLVVKEGKKLTKLSLVYAGQ